MSFVDLMANDIWSDLDIETRVQSLIRSKVSDADEFKAARLARKEAPTASDLEFIANVDSHIEWCRKQGIEARDDVLLLKAVLAYEAAVRRLALPEVEPEFDEEGVQTNVEAVAGDIEQRSEAQEVVDAAAQDVLNLFALRNPQAEEAPEEQQEE